MLVDEALGEERRRVDVVAVERLEGIEVDHAVLHAERVVEALQLRDPLGKGQLATLEAQPDAAPRRLSLHAPAGGLAAFASNAPANTPLSRVRARRRLQIVDLHDCSSTF